MTELDLLSLQLAKNYPEDKALWHDSMIKYGVNGTLDLLRKYNAGRNRGELNCQFIEWIISREEFFMGKIKDCLADSNLGLKIGNQKVKFTYYGMVFTILKWEGCYVRGGNKRNVPNRISYQRFCGDMLNLKDRLNSGNVRKTIANPMYSYNYYLDIASEAAGEKGNTIPDYALSLRPVFKELSDEIREKFLR